MSEEHTGGSSSYYDVDIEDLGEVSCLDIIEALDLSYAEGSVFKAVWRQAAARQGKHKKGNTAIYDAEKVIFFGNRMLFKAQDDARSEPTEPDLSMFSDEQIGDIHATHSYFKNRAQEEQEEEPEPDLTIFSADQIQAMRDAYLIQRKENNKVG